jgi:Family of unknown function (DUF6152)
MKVAINIKARAVVASFAFGLAALAAPAAYAHHSFAQFELSKLTALTGTVKEWNWANPHTWLHVSVVKADGAVEEWALVGSSPNMMSRWGWNAADIKVGDKVVIDIHPARDARHVGAIQTLFTADGKVLVDPAGSPGRALASGPSKLPPKPQGEAYK